MISTEVQLKEQRRQKLKHNSVPRFHAIFLQQLPRKPKVLAPTQFTERQTGLFQVDQTRFTIDILISFFQSYDMFSDRRSFAVYVQVQSNVVL